VGLLFTKELFQLLEHQSNWVGIMSVVVKLGRVLPRERTYAHFLKSGVMVCSVFVALLTMALPAWSFEVTNTEPHGQAGVIAPVMRAPAPPEEDSCLYIIRAARDKSEDSYAERQYRQDASSAAAVGLVFGVRFALGPSEVNKNRKRVRPVAAFHVWETRDSATGGGQALAIADYRACRNEQALRALTD